MKNPDFKDEEDKLLNEFVSISGVSDVSASQQNARLSSGSALALLMEQDNERLMVTAENVRDFNDFGQEEKITEKEYKGYTLKDGKLTLNMAAHSVVMLRFK